MSLTKTELYILLVLAIKISHGYEVMKQVKKYSDGSITLGPGTLYASLKKMLLLDLVSEVLVKEDPLTSSKKRRYYDITSKGREVVESELKNMKKFINVLHGKSKRSVTSILSI